MWGFIYRGIKEVGFLTYIDAVNAAMVYFGIDSETAKRIVIRSCDKTPWFQEVSK